MGLIKGGFLRILQTSLYALAFACSGIILGLYSYFLAVQSDRDQSIPTWQKAVTGLSGAACLYTIAAVILTCCLAGISFFAFIAIFLDVAFIGAMIAIAVMTRDGAGSCSGIVNTPLGRGDSNADGSGYGEGFGTSGDSNLTYSVSPRNACRMNTAAFAVAIIGAFIFLATAAMQVVLYRRHKKDKRYGPSPDNNYTSGAGNKRNFWNRKKNSEKHAEEGHMGTGTAMGAGAAGGLAAGHAHDTRPSHETGYTGSTVAAPGNTYDKVDGANGYNSATYPQQAHQGHAAHGSHGGYYTQPQGSGVNPYGYDNTGNQYTTGTATNY